MKDNKTLMVKTSVDLPKSEAYSFAKTMNHDEVYYIYKVGINPRARDACRRENWVVCRYPRLGENVKGAYVLWAYSNGLEVISGNGSGRTP
jgi:hypothetical protein